MLRATGAPAERPPPTQAHPVSAKLGAEGAGGTREVHAPAASKLNGAAHDGHPRAPRSYLGGGGAGHCGCGPHILGAAGPARSNSDARHWGQRSHARAGRHSVLGARRRLAELAGPPPRAAPELQARQRPRRPSRRPPRAARPRLCLHPGLRLPGCPSAQAAGACGGRRCARFRGAAPHLRGAVRAGPLPATDGGRDGRPGAAEHRAVRHAPADDRRRGLRPADGGAGGGGHQPGPRGDARALDAGVFTADGQGEHSEQQPDGCARASGPGAAGGGGCPAGGGRGAPAVVGGRYVGDHGRVGEG
mmetsp:Transcript_739/g.1813  ORF Transcript_739/g.1813 Transcript_739/m.1813 type:complete len:304 (+) Transcript_739:334-1245(+)